MDVLVTIPDGTDLDGAIVELAAAEHPRHMTAEIRTPAQAETYRYEHYDPR